MENSDFGEKKVLIHWGFVVQTAVCFFCPVWVQRLPRRTSLLPINSQNFLQKEVDLLEKCQMRVQTT